VGKQFVNFSDLAKEEREEEGGKGKLKKRNLSRRAETTAKFLETKSAWKGRKSQSIETYSGKKARLKSPDVPRTPRRGDLHLNEFGPSLTALLKMAKERKKSR